MSKKFLILTVFLFLPTTTLANNLFFTEVLVQGEKSQNCYIEIFNQSPEKIDVSGFKLKKKTSTGKEYSIRVFPQNSYIEAYGYFLWANSKDNYHLDVRADVSSTTQISKNNSIALFSKNNELIDALSWGEGENQFFLGNSLVFNPEKNEKIKRKKDNNTYINTKNNKNDFYISFLNQDKEKDKIKTIKDDQENNFPLSEAVKIALFSSLMIALVKRLITT